LFHLERTDPVIGGLDGISNFQATQLGNRTRFLKDALDQGIAASNSGGVLPFFIPELLPTAKTITFSSALSTIFLLSA